MYLKENTIVLFQGDSITDAKRDREPGDDLGRGYVNMAVSLFRAAYPEMDITFLNRGNSGNRVRDLKDRWQADCLDIKPGLLSIMIGINDCWQRFSKNDPTSAESFYNDYKHILTAAKEASNPQLVLCEPFVLPCPEDRKLWRDDLDDKITAVRDLAREFHALLVPLDGAFNAASAVKPPEFWAPDGVHPTPAGAALIAREWLRTVKAAI